MVQVTFEHDEVGFGKVEEEIGGFLGDGPEGVTGAPEGMLFVDPLAFAFVFFPTKTICLSDCTSASLAVGKREP